MSPDPVTDPPAAPSAAVVVPDGYVSAGRVGRGHGLDGTFHVTRPRSGAFALDALVFVAGVERRIVRLSGTDAAPLLRLEGIDGRASSDPLRGTDIHVRRAALPALDEDEFWPDDLVGLRVVDLRGAPVGTVAEVLSLPSCDVLRVPREGADELLVPLHREAVPELDVPGGVATVDMAFMGEDDPDDAAPKDVETDEGPSAAG